MVRFIVYRIVASMAGSSMSSKEDVGTAFTIRFPVRGKEDVKEDSLSMMR
jgi:hypothetical protein